jgi:hypothetical protein
MNTDRGGLAQVIFKNKSAEIRLIGVRPRAICFCSLFYAELFLYALFNFIFISNFPIDCLPENRIAKSSGFA